MENMHGVQQDMLTKVTTLLSIVQAEPKAAEPHTAVGQDHE